MDTGSSRREDKDQALSARRKAFLLALMKPSSKRGYVNCRLCQELVWGPNGRYHMEKCRVISSARKKAEEEGITLHSIKGIRIEEELFKKPKDSVPKPAKLAGFVISSTVDINDPSMAPSQKEQRMGIRTGRKGYVRCVYCNAEVYGPNAKHHAANCKKRHTPMDTHHVHHAPMHPHAHMHAHPHAHPHAHAHAHAHMDTGSHHLRH